MSVYKIAVARERLCWLVSGYVLQKLVASHIDVDKEN